MTCDSISARFSSTTRMRSRPSRELQNALRLQRPGHAHLVDADAERIGLHLVDAELVQRLAHVQIALAGGDDAELRIGAAAGDDAVELVGAREGENGRALVVVQARFLGQRLVAEAYAQAARRHREVVGNLDLDAVDAAVDRGRGLDIVLHALDADPHAGEARQTEAEDAVVENFLHACRVQHRHHVVEESELGLMRAGRAFAGVVVAHQGEHAAVLGRAGMVGVAEHVAGAVDARALAVPDAEHAVVFAFAAQLRLLRAPQRGGGQVLVQAGHELDVVGLQQALGAEHRRFQGGNRRAAVARHVAGRIEPGLHVARTLRQHQAHDGLGAGQELVRLVERVFVVEADRVLGHGGFGPSRFLARRAWAGRPRTRDARVRRLSQTSCRGRLLLQMGCTAASRNQAIQRVRAGRLRIAQQLMAERAPQQYCAPCRPGWTAMRRAIRHPGRSPASGTTGKTHFTRVNVVVLQNTAATQPDRSTAFLLLTVRVPE